MPEKSTNILHLQFNSLWPPPRTLTQTHGWWRWCDSWGVNVVPRREIKSVIRSRGRSLAPAVGWRTASGMSQSLFYQRLFSASINHRCAASLPPTSLFPLHRIHTHTHSDSDKHSSITQIHWSALTDSIEKASFPCFCNSFTAADSLSSLLLMRLRQIFSP